MLSSDVGILSFGAISPVSGEVAQGKASDFAELVKAFQTKPPPGQSTARGASISDPIRGQSESEEPEMFEILIAGPLIVPAAISVDEDRSAVSVALPTKPMDGTLSPGGVVEAADESVQIRVDGLSRTSGGLASDDGYQMSDVAPPIPTDAEKLHLSMLPPSRHTTFIGVPIDPSETPVAMSIDTAKPEAPITPRPMGSKVPAEMTAKPSNSAAGDEFGPVAPKPEVGGDRRFGESSAEFLDSRTQIIYNISEIKEAPAPAKAAILTGQQVVYASEQKDIIPQIALNIKILVGSESSEAIIRLEPEELGRVRLRLVVQDSNVSARMLVENVGVKHAIESNYSQLWESLDQQGIRIEEFEVYVGDEGRSYRGEQQVPMDQGSSGENVDPRDGGGAAGEPLRDHLVDYIA